MSSKRSLKKHIAYVCGELAAECIVGSNLIKGVDRKKMDSLVVKIAILQDSTMRHVNVAFDKAPRAFESLRAYHHARNLYYRAAYKALLDAFGKSVAEIVNEMNSALPAKKA